MFGSGTQRIATEMSVASSLNTPPVKALTSRKMRIQDVGCRPVPMRDHELDETVVAEFAVPRGSQPR